MFGWEFPPHIAGGLGTACYGMTRGLARNGVDVTFIVPHAYGDEDQRFTHVVNASDVEALYGSTGSGADDILEKMSFIHIDSNMVPYISPEEYESYHEQYVKSGRKTWSTTDAWKQRYTFSGKYGANLMEEVARYAVVAAQVARDLEGQFDVIHAHDWLTYYAGIAAKRVSGKPLVVHMHATEFDRSGENVNTQVYAIERAGMHAADRVIAVSNLTRNIVINRYGVPAEKIVTVHNAVRFAQNSGKVPERGVTDKVVTFLGRITYKAATRRGGRQSSADPRAVVSGRLGGHEYEPRHSAAWRGSHTPTVPTSRVPSAGNGRRTRSFTRRRTST